MPFFDKYPYTNFHNINLDWVLQRVKELDGKVVELNDYVTNLDYQELVSNTINALIESGAFSDIVNPIISQYVTEWLDEHITSPEGIIIDDTLTIEGACADAKATGDRIDIDGFNLASKYALMALINELEYRNRNGRNYLNTLETLLNIGNYEVVDNIADNILYGAISSNPNGYPSDNPNSRHYNNTTNLTRLCYTYFNLYLNANTKYRILINSVYPQTQVAIFRLTENGFNLASTGQTMPFNATNIYDISGFVYSGYEFTVDSDCYVWLSVRIREGNVDIECKPEDILSITLYKEV